MADFWDCLNCGRPQNDLMRHLINLNERIDTLEDALIEVERIVREANWMEPMARREQIIRTICSVDKAEATTHFDEGDGRG